VHLTPRESRKRIEKEDDLINHRMSWCVASNTFLLSAYSLGGSIKPWYAVVVGSSLEIVPIVGFLLSYVYIISILSAFFAIWKWRDLSKDTNCSRIDSTESVFSSLFIAYFGSLASIISPVLLLSIWFVLLTNEMEYAEVIVTWTTIVSASVWFVVFYSKEAVFKIRYQSIFYYKKERVPIKFGCFIIAMVIAALLFSSGIDFLNRIISCKQQKIFSYLIFVSLIMVLWGLLTNIGRLLYWKIESKD